MSAMMALPKDDPIMLAWEVYKITPEYANSRNWAKHDEHLDGSLWAAFLSGYQARTAHVPGPAPTTQSGDAMAGHGCVDCHRQYGDAFGFPDLIIPDAAWAKISPTGHGGGLLCPSCICKRLFDAKVECVGRFTSGPLCQECDPKQSGDERAAAEVTPAEIDELCQAMWTWGKNFHWDPPAHWPEHTVEEWRNVERGRMQNFLATSRVAAIITKHMPRALPAAAVLTSEERDFLRGVQMVVLSDRDTLTQPDIVHLLAIIRRLTGEHK